jgi:hypothetical protein
MNELIEIQWTPRLEDDLARFIQDRCQYQPGVTALSAIADAQTFQAEFAARQRTQRRAIAALKELLTRHARPAIDSDIAEAMGKFQALVAATAAPERPAVIEEVSAAAEYAETALAHKRNRPGGNDE